MLLVAERLLLSVITAQVPHDITMSNGDTNKSNSSKLQKNKKEFKDAVTKELELDNASSCESHFEATMKKIIVSMESKMKDHINSMENIMEDRLQELESKFEAFGTKLEIRLKVMENKIDNIQKVLNENSTNIPNDVIGTVSHNVNLQMDKIDAYLQQNEKLINELKKKLDYVVKQPIGRMPAQNDSSNLTSSAMFPKPAAVEVTGKPFIPTYQIQSNPTVPSFISSDKQEFPELISGAEIAARFPWIASVTRQPTYSDTSKKIEVAPNVVYPQKRTIYGKKQSTIKSVPRRSVVFASRLDIETSGDELKKMLEEAGLEEVKVIKIKPKDGVIFKTSAFCVSCLADSGSGSRSIYDEDIWPEGVEVREWVFRPQTL